MIQLTTNLSSSLIDLIRAGSAPIDAIEVGHWSSVAQIQAYRQQFPGYPFYFHASNLVSELRWTPGTLVRTQAYLQCTQSPWLSLHCSLLPPSHVWLAAHYGWFLPPPDNRRAVRGFITAAVKLKTLGLPLLLENWNISRTKKSCVLNWSASKR